MIFPVDFNFLKTTIIRSIIAEHMTKRTMSETLKNPMKKRRSVD